MQEHPLLPEAYSPELPSTGFAPVPASMGVTVKVTLASVAQDVARTLRLPRPADVVAAPHLRWAVWRRVAGLYALGMVAALVVVMAAVKVSGAANLLEEMRQGATTSEGKLKLLLLAGVIAPLWEETAFRLPLARFHAARLLPALALCALLLGTALPSWARPIALSVLGALGLAMAATLMSQPWRARVEAWWSRHFCWVVAFFVAAFGLAHGGNYRFSSPGILTLLAIPFLVTPQLIGGALLAYVRQRLGFWYGVALHSSANTFLVGLSLLVPTDKPKPPVPSRLPTTSLHSQPARPVRPARPASANDASSL